MPRDGIPATELDVCAGGGPGNEPGSELLSSRPLCCGQEGQCSPPNGSLSLPPWPRARTPFWFHRLRAAVLKTGGKSSWARLGPESSHLPAWVSSPGSESGPAALRPPGRQVCCCHCPRGPGTVSLSLSLGTVSLSLSLWGQSLSLSLWGQSLSLSLGDSLSLSLSGNSLSLSLSLSGDSLSLSLSLSHTHTQEEQEGGEVAGPRAWEDPPVGRATF
uniref:Uncharacterized protein n=1 Tax=Mustela putorius furo TaxID=9669 RepID=M3XZC4_MUSPF